MSTVCLLQQDPAKIRDCPPLHSPNPLNGPITTPDWTRDPNPHQVPLLCASWIRQGTFPNPLGAPPSAPSQAEGPPSPRGAPWGCYQGQRDRGKPWAGGPSHRGPRSRCRRNVWSHRSHSGRPGTGHCPSQCHALGGHGSEDALRHLLPPEPRLSALALWVRPYPRAGPGHQGRAPQAQAVALAPGCLPALSPPCGDTVLIST